MMELNGRPATAEALASLGLYNYGHFTSMRVEDMTARGLSLHLERLSHDCRTLMGTELDLDRVRHYARQVCAVAESPMILRITVYDPALELGHPSKPADPHVLVTTRPAATQPLPPLELHTIEYERDVPQVKGVGLFATMHHRRIAQLAGYGDSLFHTRDGLVSEGATWNIAFVRDGRLVWPEADCLSGVTMRLIEDVARKAGITTSTEPVRVDEIPRMDAAFVTNAAIGLRAVASIEDTDFPGQTSLMEPLRKEYTRLLGEPL